MKTILKFPWLPLIIMLLSLGLADCGKKGPPVPPDEPKEESPSPLSLYKGELIAPNPSFQRRGTQISSPSKGEAGRG